MPPEINQNSNEQDKKLRFYRKQVHLKDHNIWRDRGKIKLTPGIEMLKWQVTDNEAYCSINGPDKNDINAQLAKMPILSDRCRTLKHIPKVRIINTKKYYIN